LLLLRGEWGRSHSKSQDQQSGSCRTHHTVKYTAWSLQKGVFDYFAGLLRVDPYSVIRLFRLQVRES
jgi:hypothetical protein